MQTIDSSIAVWITELKGWWSDVLGIDADEVDWRPDESLISWLQRTGCYEDLDFADVLFRLKTDFGTVATPADLMQFFMWNDTQDAAAWLEQVSPQLTIVRFAQWVRSHTPLPTPAPAEICGHPSRVAGAYLGLAAIAEEFAPPRPFGPGTQIIEIARGRNLLRFWRRARLFLANRQSPEQLQLLTELQFPYRRMSGGLEVSACVGALVALVSGLAGASQLAVGCGVLAVASACAAARLRYAGDPVPAAFSRLKDLARMVDEPVARRASRSPSGRG